MPAETPLPPGKRHCPRCKGKGHVGPKINARSKGQRGEREVISLLQPVVNRVAAAHSLTPPVLQRNALQAHLGGNDIHGLDWISFEVKYCENEQLGPWWNQTLRQAAKNEAVPVLFYRCNNAPFKVMFRAYLNTPKDRDQIEMDVVTTVEDFLSWFENALDERFAGA